MSQVCSDQGASTNNNRLGKIMSSIVCTTCGRTSNTAVANYWPDLVVTKCYAAFEDGKWVRGCAYDEVRDYKKQMIDKLLENRDV